MSLKKIVSFAISPTPVDLTEPKQMQFHVKPEITKPQEVLDVLYKIMKDDGMYFRNPSGEAVMEISREKTTAMRGRKFLHKIYVVDEQVAARRDRKVQIKVSATDSGGRSRSKRQWLVVEYPEEKR